MARIRSIHPGIFTDEGFMSLSVEARVLLIGIWCEAFDDGVFAWKPLTLKARIFPADNVDIGNLLSELNDAQFLTQFDHDGKFYGAVRNFRLFQRPKKPNSSELLPDHLRTYVGLTVDGSPPVPNQLPTSSEKSPQMEDGGDNRKRKSSGFSEDKKPIRTSSKTYPDDFEDFWKTWKTTGGGGDKSPAHDAWKKLSAPDREFAAQVAVLWFEAWRNSAPDATAIHASTYLNKRRFDGFEPPTSGKTISMAGKSVVTNSDPLWPALVERNRREKGRGVNAESWAFDDAWIADARSTKPTDDDLDRSRHMQDLMSSVGGNA